MLALLLTAASPEEAAVNIPLWLDLAAVVVGAFSGLLYAQERSLDLVGHIGLAIICGLGGGLIRDTIMQVGDVYMLNSPYAIWVCVATACAGFFFPGLMTHFPNLIEWVDIIAVALFAAAGTDKAIIYDLHFSAVILMGTMTGVGGGMMRDVFLGEVPRIFQKSNFYAICAIAGSAAFWLCASSGLRKGWAVVVCMLVTVALRRWSLHNDVYTPTDVNLAPSVKRFFRRKKR